MPSHAPHETHAPVRILPARAVLAAIVLAGFVVILSCGGGEPTALLVPTVTTLGSLRFNVTIPDLVQNAAFADVAGYDRARVIVRRADGTVAADTTLMLSPNSRSVIGHVSIKLASSGTAGETVSLDISIVDGQGTVVFRATAAGVRIAPDVGGQSSTPTFDVTVAYVGPGAAVKTLRVQPRTRDVIAGGAFTFTAVSLDAAGAAVAGAPVAWLSLDPARATITTSGAGVAETQRGPARIIAQSITGATDTVIVNSMPVASSIAMVSGNDQTGSAGEPTALAQPLVVRVTATDGLALANVAVTFAAQNGGSVAPTSVTTDANGLAQTIWTLGSAAGAQTATASAVGVAGAPVLFAATAVSSPATGFTLTVASGNNQNEFSGTQLATILVQVIDAGRNGVVGVPVTFTVGSGGGTVSPGSTVTGPMGFATASWTLGGTVGSQTLMASSAGVSSVTITATAMPRPSHFVFTQQPATTQTSMLPITPAMVIELRDALDRLVTSYNGPVTLGFNSNVANGQISGIGTVNAANGVATFSDARLDRVGIYQLAAIQTGYLSGYSSFVTVVPGAPTTLRVVAGDNQIAAAGATLTFPVRFAVADAGGNGLSGVTVTLAAGGGGTVTPASAATSVFGSVDATWTLGASGAQSLVGSTSDIPSATANATIGGPALQITGTTALGTRQYADLGTNRVGIPALSTTPVVITLESLDPNVATVPASVTVPPGVAEIPFVITSHDQVGTAQIRATAPGYSAATTTVKVTRARFVIAAPDYLWFNSPKTPFTIFATDSTGAPHYSTENLVIPVGTTTPSVISVDAPTVTIAAGSSYSSSANVAPVAPGRARLTATDARAGSFAYLPATFDLDVLLVRAYLGFSNQSPGLDQYTTGSLDLGYPPTSMITTPLVHSAIAHTVTTPTSTVHTAGQSSVPVRLTALSIGVDTITATPQGQASVSIVITVGKGAFEVNLPNPVRVGDSAAVYIDLRGPNLMGGVFAAVPTTLTLSPSAGVQLVSGGSSSAPVTSVTIPTGASRAVVWAKGVSSGAASVTMSAPNYVTYVFPLGVNP